MRVLLLGATGRTGRMLLEQLLHRGFQVTVVVRNPDKVKLSHSHLEIVQGTPADINLLEKAIQRCNAVISALNISRVNDFPWARLRTPKDFLSDCMHKILAVMSHAGCRRLIVTSAWGVNESRAQLPGWFSWLVRNSNIRFPYDDLGKMEKIIQSSGTDFTIVRPVALTNSSKEKPFTIVTEGRPSKLMISRRNVAKFMVDALKLDSQMRSIVVIS